MKIRIPIYKKTYALLAGMLCVAALPPYYTVMAAVVGFCVLMCLLNVAQSKKQAFAIGYWFGFGFFSLGFSWIGNAVLIEPERTGWLFPLILLGSGGFFGFFAAFPAMFTQYAGTIWKKVLVFAASWTIFEWIRGFFLSGFPWNPVGSMFAFSPQMIQSASIFGIYGLSFVAVLLFCLPSVWIRNKKSESLRSLALILLIAGSNYGFGVWRLANNQEKTFDSSVRIVQPSIPQAIKWESSSLGNNFAQYSAMSAQKGIDNIDFVIWGETASPYNPRFLAKYNADFFDAVPKNGYLLFGVVDYELESGEYRPKNSMMVMNKAGEIIDSYDKSHLVPFGEYIPLRKYLPKWVQPVAKIVGDFKKGNAHKVIRIKNQPDFGALICYEVIFPAKVVDKSSRPQWIVVLSNDGWYGNSMGPYQHLVAAQLRAIEEGIGIVRSANSGISAVIDAYGQIKEKIDLGKRDILDAKIPQPIDKITFYSQFQNYPVIFSCLFLVIFIMRSNLQEKVEKAYKITHRLLTKIKNMLNMIK